MKNHNEDDEEDGENDYTPQLPADPAILQRMLDTKRSAMREAVKKASNLEDDELDVLAPDDMALEKLYLEIRKTKTRVSEAYLDEDEDDESPGDDETLVVSETDQDHAAYRLKEAASKNRRIKMLLKALTEEQATQLAEAVDRGDVEAVEDTMVDLDDPSAGMSYEELMKSLGMSDDDDDDDDDDEDEDDEDGD